MNALWVWVGMQRPTRGHSAGCYLNNAKAERNKNIGVKQPPVFGLD